MEKVKADAIKEIEAVKNYVHRVLLHVWRIQENGVVISLVVHSNAQTLQSEELHRLARKWLPNHMHKVRPLETGQNNDEKGPRTDLSKKRAVSTHFSCCRNTNCFSQGPLRKIRKLQGKSSLSDKMLLLFYPGFAQVQQSLRGQRHEIQVARCRNATVHLPR